jgi:hypothetical protein
MIQPGSRIDPDDIADKFWQLFKESGDNREVEIIWQ